MKKKVNLTIDENVLMRAKKYAKAKNISLSQIVEISISKLDVGIGKKKNSLDEYYKKNRIYELDLNDEEINKILDERIRKYR